MDVGESENSFPLFGREEIFSRLEQRVEALKKGYRQNIGLVGPRFIGKTYLLARFLGKVRKDPDLISIYVPLDSIDLESFSERWLGALLRSFLASKQIPSPEEFQSLVKVCGAQIPKTLDRMQEAKKHLLAKRPAQAFRELLSLTGVLRDETGKQILLILDEFQALGDLELTDPFGLFGKEMMVQKDTLYLATSSQPHRSREIFEDRLSLLFGNFEVIRMGPLSVQAAREWAAHFSTEMSLSDPHLRVLSHLFDNHPYYLHLFFREGQSLVAQKRSEGEGPEFFLRVLQESLFSPYGLLNLHFQSELKSLLRLARFPRPYLRTLLAIANGRMKTLPIAAYLGRKSSEIKKLLQRLVDEGVLEKRGSFYRLGDPLFRFWLREVFQLKDRNLEPGAERLEMIFQARLRDEVHRIEEEDQKDLTERVGSLFREFRNDVVEIERKKVTCPAFLEVASRPTNGRYFPIFGRTSQGRWFCQVSRELLTEADVTAFVEELKKFRRKVDRRLLVALGGIELNAKLLAQESKIQIWDLENFNAILELFGKLKVIE